MRRLPLPTFQPDLVYDTCVGSITEQGLRTRLQNLRDVFLTQGESYLQHAHKHELFRIQPISVNNDNDVVMNQITLGEFKKLYSNHFAGKTKPARTWYDQLITSLPQGRCPFCGFGQASTIDHFLPKAKFSWLSIFIPNLVPACKDCNHGKGIEVANAAREQLLHPYFEDPRIEAEQWLFADIEHTNPISLNFIARPPAGWSVELSSRVTNHLRELELSRRFGLEAANELACLNPMLRAIGQAGGSVADQLQMKFDVEFQLSRNSWRTALYQSLATSPWYTAQGHMQ